MANRPQKLSKGQHSEVVSILRKKLLAYVITALALTTGFLGIGLWQIKVRLEKKMESMITVQFEEPRIRQTVLEAAATKAQDLLIKQIQPEVDAFKGEIVKKTSEADEKLANIQQSVVKASSSMSVLETINEFMMTVLAAQNDDRKAFDRLEEWSKDESHSFRVEAKRAWRGVMESIDVKLIFPPRDVPWKNGLDPSKLMLSDLENHFKSSPKWIKRAMLKYIWGRNDISKVERLDFLMSVMKSDSSLNVVGQAGRYFTIGTKKKILPLAVSYLSEWWQEHREKFKEQELQSGSKQR